MRLRAAFFLGAHVAFLPLVSAEYLTLTCQDYDSTCDDMYEKATPEWFGYAATHRPTTRFHSHAC